MQTVIGVTRTAADARRAAEDVVRAVPAARVRVLASEADAEPPPDDDAAGRGSGAALGAAAGGVAGMAAGTMMAPPFGAIVVATMAAGALLGAVGGQAMQDATELPDDDRYLYADVLRSGRAVVSVSVEADADADDARRALAAAGAGTPDDTRDDWWRGLRDIEAADYGDAARFEADEPAYRQGFEAACRGAEPPTQAADPAFCTGYARGRAYVEARWQELAVTRPRIVDEPSAPPV
jgi:hypothetical protein